MIYCRPYGSTQSDARLGTEAVEGGFAAVAKDISRIKDEVSGIKGDISDMKGEKSQIKKTMVTKEGLHQELASIQK